MQEALLHYVWLHQRFRKQELKTVSGYPLNIVHPGFLNKDAGPDFSQAKLIIDDIEWNGSVEIHVKSSEWDRHNHTHDKAYDNVVLHVVWENDKNIIRSDGTEIPVLELHNRVEVQLLEDYQKLIDSKAEVIPCANHFPKVKRITKISMLDRLVTERLMVKSKDVLNNLKANHNDWEQTAYQLLLKTIGSKVNGAIFEQLATYLPIKVLKKEHGSPFKLESLLFGMAGFLDANVDPYQAELQKEFQFLKHKHQLDEIISEESWKFMRLRPAAFPTLRLGQLAMLFCQQLSIFSLITEFESKESLVKTLKCLPSVYWQNHYHFDKPSKKKLGGFGDATIDLIIINVAVPLLAAYSQHMDDQSYLDRAVELLEHTKAEHNVITRKFEQLKLTSKSALDSQGIIQWYNAYCSQKKCLDCSVGHEILDRT